MKKSRIWFAENLVPVISPTYWLQQNWFLPEAAKFSLKASHTGPGLCSAPNGHLSTSLNMPQLALIAPLVCHLSRGAEDRKPCRD